VKQGDSELWNDLEEKVKLKISKKLSARDATWVLWSFASMRKGSTHFWETME